MPGQTRHESTTRELLSCAAWASVIAAIATLGIDIIGLSPEPGPGWPRMLGGFAAVLGATLFAAATVAILARKLAGRLTRRPILLRLAIVLPALPLIVRTSRLLFLGGKMQNYAFGGLGPISAAILITVGVLVLIGLLESVTRRARGPLYAAFLALGMVAASRWIDANVQPEAYLYLHQFIVIARVALLCVAIFLLLPRRLLGKDVMALAGLAITGAMVWLAVDHVRNFHDSPSALRRLIGQDLRTSARLWTMVPYRKTSGRLEAPPAGLSERALRHLQLRTKARDEINATGESRDDWNVIIFSVDAIRHDHTSLGGHDRDTTPFLAKWAQRGVDFSQARSPSTASFYSLTSMLTGMEPVTLDLARGRSELTLASHLEGQGWATAGFYSPFIYSVRDRSWPKPDPEKELGFASVSLGSSHASEVVDGLLAFADAQRERPFFAFAHVMDPHAPYEKQAEGDWGDRPIDRYDSELAHVDSEFKRLCSELEARGIADHTVLVFSSDHGEAFGEAGQYRHGGTPNLVQSHVPLVIVAPGLLEPQKVDAPVSNVSISATICDLLGIDDLAQNEAPSLLPLAFGLDDGSQAYCVVERPAFSQNPGISPARSLVHAGHELVIDMGLGVGRLYDLDRDPFHGHDISGREPTLMARLEALEQEWRSDLLARKARQKGDTDSFPAEFENDCDMALRGDSRVLSEFPSWLEDDDPRVRRRAAEVLFDVDTSRTTDERVFPRYEGEDEFVTTLSRAVSFARGRIDLGQELLDRLGGDDPAVETRLIRAIAVRSSAIEDLSPLVERFVTLEDGPLRFEIACALGRAGRPDASRLLLERVEKAQGVELEDAIDAAAHVPDEDVWRRLVAIGNRRGREVLKSLAARAGVIDTPYRRAWLRDQFRSPRVSRRADALKGVHDHPDADFRLEMYSLIARFEIDRRFRGPAAARMQRYDDEATLGPLIDICATDENLGRKVARQLVETCSEFDDSRGRLSLESREIRPGERLELTVPSSEVGAEAETPRRLYLVLQLPAAAVGGTIRISRPGGLEVGRGIDSRDVVVSLNELEPGSKLALTAMDATGQPCPGLLQGLVHIPVRSPESLWPANFESADRCYAFTRFVGKWRAADSADGFLWLCEGRGEFRFHGADEAPRKLRVVVRSPAASMIRLSLNGAEILSTELLAGDSELTCPLGSATYETAAGNVLELEIRQTDRKMTELPHLPGGRLGVASIVSLD